MRFLGVGDSCDLGSLYRRLLQEGHEVRVQIADPLCQGTLAGIVPRGIGWDADLAWVKAAGPDGIILFENVAKQRGQQQDQLRAQGFNVIGGSAYGDRLENDRGYAQEILAALGLKICPTHSFQTPGEALEFLRRHPGRYVLKFNGPGFSSSDNYVGRLEDGRDVAAMIRLRLHETDSQAGAPSFILMRYVEGVEMGVGAYFNGSHFLRPACLDWEHKRFFPGDLGELTGEMGTVATYQGTERFFAQTLAKMEPLLKANGYLGYINLNTIVNEEGIWPLEFTCRFGYPGFAVLDPLQETRWGALFSAMIRRNAACFETRAGFSVGVVLTTPPFPYTRHDVADEIVGLPVLFDAALKAEDDDHLHFGEMGMEGTQLVTSGLYGWTLVVTGTGASIEAAKQAAYRRVSGIYVPNLRYRHDIGDGLLDAGLARVTAWGFWEPVRA